MINSSSLDFWTKPASDAIELEPDGRFGQSENLRVKQTVSYIICGIIFRGSKDDAEVLLIQEVRGDWYLPAGRLEAGETLEDGMKREMKEEAGVECESLGLILVETHRPAWYRFTYLAKHTGGHLKTLAQSDGESLQATWFRVDRLLNGATDFSETPLRSRDIIRLVRLAFLRRYGEGGNTVDEASLCRGRTIERPTGALLARFVLVCGNQVLFRRRHFPLVEYPVSLHLGTVAKRFIESITDATYKSELKTISVEAYPVPAYQHDGCCLTILVEMTTSDLKRAAEQDGYHYLALNSDKDLNDSVDFWRKNHAALVL